MKAETLRYINVRLWLKALVENYKILSLVIGAVCTFCKADCSVKVDFGTPRSPFFEVNSEGKTDQAGCCNMSISSQV